MNKTQYKPHAHVNGNYTNKHMAENL